LGALFKIAELFKSKKVHQKVMKTLTCIHAASMSANIGGQFNGEVKE
jgi:hypothetical protein